MEGTTLACATRNWTFQYDSSANEAPYSSAFLVCVGEGGQKALITYGPPFLCQVTIDIEWKEQHLRERQENGHFKSSVALIKRI